MSACGRTQSCQIVRCSTLCQQTRIGLVSTSFCHSLTGQNGTAHCAFTPQWMLCMWKPSEGHGFEPPRSKRLSQQSLQSKPPHRQCALRLCGVIPLVCSEASAHTEHATTSTVADAVKTEDSNSIPHASRVGLANRINDTPTGRTK